jgi:hypothetical protein
LQYIDSRGELVARYGSDRAMLRQRLEINLASPMWRLDKETLDRNLAAEIHLPVLSIAVREDRDGRAFASAASQRVDLHPLLQDTLEFPISINQAGTVQALGWVTVVTTHEEIDQALRELVWRRVLETVLLVTVLVLALSYALQALVLRPLAETSPGAGTTQCTPMLKVTCLATLDVACGSDAICIRSMQRSARRTAVVRSPLNTRMANSSPPYRANISSARRATSASNAATCRRHSSPA